MAGRVGRCSWPQLCVARFRPLIASEIRGPRGLRRERRTRATPLLHNLLGLQSPRDNAAREPAPWTLTFSSGLVSLLCFLQVTCWSCPCSGVGGALSPASPFLGDRERLSGAACHWAQGHQTPWLRRKTVRGRTCGRSRDCNSIYSHGRGRIPRANVRESCLSLGQLYRCRPLSVSGEHLRSVAGPPSPPGGVHSLLELKAPAVYQNPRQSRAHVTRVPWLSIHAKTK